MGKILIILWITAFCLIADAHKRQRLQKTDLQAMVDAIKEDVNRHLKKVLDHATRRLAESSTLSPTAVPSKEPTRKEKFLKALGEAMGDHLVRNLGPPSDASLPTASPKVHKKYTKKLSSTDGMSTTQSVSASPVTQAASIKTDKGYKDIRSTTGYTGGKSTTQSVSAFPVTLPSTSTPKSKDSYESSTHRYPVRIGSMRGVPGVNFPDYTDIPITSFTCSDKTYLPGFYADLDTGCQVFHVCWPNRRESFLCPMGTIFNQPLLACDYWYSANCSLAPHYYDVNANPDASKVQGNEDISSMINDLHESSVSSSTAEHFGSSESGSMTPSSILSLVSQFLPVKARVVVFPESAGKNSKIIASASIGERPYWSKPRQKREVSECEQESLNLNFNAFFDFIKYWLLPAEDKEISELRGRIFATRFLEALDCFVEDIKRDDAMARYRKAAEDAVNNRLEAAEKGLIPEPFYPLPGSELSKYDVDSKNFVEFIFAFLKYIMNSINLYEITRSEAEENHKPAPLTQLNPRFIVKREAEKKQGKRVLPAKVAKQQKAEERPDSESSQSDHSNISPETKKLLLKSYLKLFKVKSNNA